MRKRIVVGLASVVLIGVTLSFTTPTERYFEIAKNLDIFATMFRELNLNYVDETKPGELMKKGIDEMLVPTHDPQAAGTLAP